MNKNYHNMMKISKICNFVLNPNLLAVSIRLRYLYCTIFFARVYLQHIHIYNTYIQSCITMLWNTNFYIRKINNSYSVNFGFTFLS